MRPAMTNEPQPERREAIDELISATRELYEGPPDPAYVDAAWRRLAEAFEKARTNG